MHVRVELGQEAAVTAHAADGAARLQLAPAGSGGTSRGRRLAATHGSNGDLRRRMRCMRSIGCSLGRGRHVANLRDVLARVVAVAGISRSRDHPFP